jgi:hypothetical protein
MAFPYQLHHQKQTKQQQQGNLSSSQFDFRILQKAFWIWDEAAFSSCRVNRRSMLLESHCGLAREG